MARGGGRGRLAQVWAVVEDFAYRSLINLGAVVALITLVPPVPIPLRVLGVLAGLASVVAVVARRFDQLKNPSGSALLGYFSGVRVVLLVAVAGGAWVRHPVGPWVWLAAGLAVLLVLTESLLKSLFGTVKMAYAHVPGIGAIRPQRFAPDRTCQASLGVIVLGALLAALGAPGWIWLLLVIASVPLSVFVAERAVRATLSSRRAERRLPAVLEKLQPEFAVYYAAVSGARYQLGMWLPYLERLGRPYVVITRAAETVPVIADLTNAPVISPRPGKDVATRLDKLVVPSLKAAFYVQGSPGNQTFQRYRKLTHVWLNHGDSDKQANFHPRHASYDKLFVSGQQGVDRYAAHGIEVAAEKFEIVGRPQIEKIQVRDEPLAPGAPRTVLYAPTWKGGRPSTDYSSLPHGLRMIEGLLARGSTVVFRPHPLSYNDATDAKRIGAIHALLAADAKASGRHHRWGAQAEREMDVPDCFNASDALITDVSSIASDYLASGKPFAMVAKTASGEAFAAEFPMARVAYVIEWDLSTLDAALDHLHGDDPLAPARLAYRTYCLGEHLGAEAPTEFFRVAGAIVSGQR